MSTFMSTLMRVLLESEAPTETEIPSWVTTLTDALTTFINPVLIIACTAGIIYAIVVGIRFVKADDKSARDEAKAKLISVIIGVVVTIILVVVFYWLKDALPTIISETQDSSGLGPTMVNFLKF